MKRYFNKTENKWYSDDEILTAKLKNGLFIGVPDEDKLKELGYEEVTPTPISEEEKQDKERLLRMGVIKSELARTDYLEFKFLAGDDMSKYGDWRGERNAWREEYNKLEEEHNNYINSKVNYGS